MHVIVINAAPRMEAGNTQTLLTPFLVGMRRQGAKIDIVLASRKTIKPCRGCFTCYADTPGVCIYQDDMQRLLERIRKADLMVSATPVYFDGMTSLAKKIVDRLVPFLDPHFESLDGKLRHPLRWKFPGKLFLVSVCGYAGLHNFDPLLHHMERLAWNMHSEFCGALLRPAAFSLLLTKKYPVAVRNVMEAARAAGEELVRYGKVSEAVLQAVAADICTMEELMQTANKYWDKKLDANGDIPA